MARYCIAGQATRQCIARFVLATATWAAITSCGNATRTQNPHHAASPTTKAAAAPTAPRPALSAADARHLLSRFAFGPSATDLKRVMALGTAGWIDAQLNAHPNAPTTGLEDTPRETNSKLERALAPYRAVLSTPATVLARFQREGTDEYALEKETPKPSSRAERAARMRRRLQNVDNQRLLLTHQMAELTRHLLSERQLEEVMVDFWTNHFNVYVRKGGQAKLLLPEYVEKVIRPHALGQFLDLLVGTARHPAMLLYLDNAQSSVKNKKGRGGLNENYARELLELHTLGVDGGYTQADVRQTARVLTGWGVSPLPEASFEYRFYPGRHDRGVKTVLGQRFDQGGEREGLALLEMLAKHPATAHHLATKLCQRFVADTPPDDCVQAAKQTFLESNGDVGRTVRSIALGPWFYAPKHRGQKFKSPLEFALSAARALDAYPDGSTDFARAVNQLGEGKFLSAPPTGYAERSEAWLSSAGLQARFDFALRLAETRNVGLTYDPLALFAGATEPAALAKKTQALLLGEPAEATPLIERQLAQLQRPEVRRVTALALALASPEFQRQ